MDDVGRSILWFALAALALCSAVLFSAANEAFDDAGVSRLRKLAEEENDERARKLLRLQSKVQPFALKVNLCGAVSLLLCTVFSLLGVCTLTTVWWQTAIAMFVILWLIVLCGLALPRVLAESDPTGFVLKMHTPLRTLFVLFAPYVLTVYHLVLPLGKRNEELPEEDERTEEEIRLLVEAGADAGAIEASENEMIDNIFEFDDRTVGEVMTHRTDVFAVNEDAGLEEILDIALKEGVSRIPVYKDRIDKIIGILYIKDLLSLLSDPSRSFRLEEFVRPVLYTPEQTMCNTLFREFQQKKVHFAIAVDEYGGTAGIVTMEDLLEAIVGNIQDEYDHEEEMIHNNEDGSYLLHGDLELDLLKKELDLNFPDADSADTLGGVLINALQRIPEEGEMPTLVEAGWTLQVVEVKDRHIEKVLAIPPQNEQDANETEEEENSK